MAWELTQAVEYCEYCADHVSPSGYWCCPMCDAEWPDNEPLPSDTIADSDGDEGVMSNIERKPTARERRQIVSSRLWLFWHIIKGTPAYFAMAMDPRTTATEFEGYDGPRVRLVSHEQWISIAVRAHREQQP